MGLARELTIGKKKSRSTVGKTGDYALIAAMTAKVNLGRPVDVEEFRAAIARVGGQRTRMRFIEGARYTEACMAFEKLTGERIGPQVTYL